MLQSDALKILKTGANVFLTGEPGSGKTHTVRAYIDWLREQGINCAVTASTGIAATHLFGMTIHSWSGIGIREELDDYALDNISSNKNVYRRVHNASVLIIDEISMIDAQTLDMIDAVCKAVRRNERPFGGLQVVLIGDFFQLPPVSRAKYGSNYASNQEEIKIGETGSNFSFGSRAWQKSDFITCYLEENFRQEDDDFLELLNAIRRNNVSEAHIEKLRSHSQKQNPSHNRTKLFPKNIDVDRINTQELSEVKGDEKIFEMTARGPEIIISSIKRGCLSPEKLILKKSARVMFTKNDVERRYVNGTLGIVQEFSSDSYPIVLTDSGIQIEAVPEEWRAEENGRVLAQVTQVPLRLAWAITVHKSQGMTLDSAHMDLSQSFEYGQGYVALSRVRSFSGLSLAGFNQKSLEVNPEVVEKDEEFKRYSDLSRETFSKMSNEELLSMHTDFIKSCGGNVKKTRQKGSKIKETQSKTRKGDTLITTLSLIKQNKSLSTIAEERDLTKGTIIGHINDLYIKGMIDKEELHILIEKEIPKFDFGEIFKVFETLGTQALKPVKEKLGDEVSYDELQLARLLFIAEK